MIPTIEIYGDGFKVWGRTLTGKLLRGLIEGALRDIGLYNAVIAVISADPRSCGMERRIVPFIRIYSTDAYDMENIVKKLKSDEITINIQEVVLHGFSLAGK